MLAPAVKLFSSLVFAALLGMGATAMADTSSSQAPAAVETRDASQIWNLVDHTGRNVSEDDFRGRFRLIVFGYTFCPDVCPTGLIHVAEVMDGLDERARFVLPVFVTIDPNRDTPDVLADYVVHFHPRLVGLTGTEAQIAEISDAYGVVRIPEPAAADGTYFLAHSADKYLLAPNGKVIATFDHDAPPEEIESYLEQLFARMGV